MMIYKPFLHLIPITNIQEKLEFCKRLTENQEEYPTISNGDSESTFFLK